MSTTQPRFPDELAPIQKSGFAIWSSSATLSPDFRKLFDDGSIPVVGFRHVRQWGIQVDDERELMDHERTSIADEELWQVVLQAKDGATYEVNSKLLVAVAR